MGVILQVPDGRVRVPHVNQSSRTSTSGRVISRSARASWAPTVIGAGVGALCALLAQRRKPRPLAVVAMGVVGGFVGFTAGVAWETRDTLLWNRPWRAAQYWHHA